MGVVQSDTHPGPPKVFALAVKPDGELVAGTVGRGLWCSRNGWREWRAPSSDQFGVNTLVAEPDGRLYAGTVGRGVMASADGGEHWQDVGVGLGDATVNAVLPFAGGVLAGTEGKGIAWLQPGGVEWHWLDAGMPATVYRLLDGPRCPLAATLERGVRSIAVPGRPYELISQLSGPAVHALLGRGSEIYAGTSGNGLHRSLDGGRSWRPLAPHVVDPVVHALASDGMTVLAGTATGVVGSRDGGVTWEDVSEGLASRRIFSVAVAPNGRLLAGGYDGVWVSTAFGARWRSLAIGMSAPEVYAVTVGSSGLVLAGGHGRLWRSDDLGATWTSTVQGLGGRAIYGISEPVAGRRYLATDDGVLVESRDGEWADAGLVGRCVLAVARQRERLLAATLGNGLWASCDDGRTWTRAADFTCQTATDVRVTSAGVFATGLDARTGSKTGGVFRAADSGDGWRRLDVPPLAAYRIVEAPDGGIYVGAQRSMILRSDDAGATWRTLATTGLVDAKLYALAAAPDGRIYIGTDGGVLVSEDRCLTWRACAEHAKGATPYSLAVSTTGEVVCGTSQGLRTWFVGRIGA